MRRIVSTALGALLCAAPALAQEYPRVELVYQHVPFDLFCEQWRNTKIEQSWKEEIESKIAAYQEFWNKEAPLLLEAVVSEVGKPFQRFASLEQHPELSPPAHCHRKRRRYRQSHGARTGNHQHRHRISQCQ